jgi:MFS transporter, PAT family, beta-lactamase induction signal transducer AmpG
MPTIPARMWPALALLGFACGLPQPLIDATLATWLTAEGWSKSDVVLFGWVTLPLTLKVLWAPVVDRLVPPFLGRRRGWLVLMQVVILIGLVVLAFSDPRGPSWILVVSALLVATAAATQDLAANGYTCDALPAERLPAGAGLWVWGYRVAMALSIGGAVWIAGIWGWSTAYLVMAGGMLLGMVGTLLAPTPQRSEPPLSWEEALVEPLRDFHGRLGGAGLALLLVFVMCYRLPDGMANLLIPVIQTELFANITNLGTTRLWVGVVGAALGALLAALSTARLGVMSSLLWLGIIQALSNVGYIGLDQQWWGGSTGLAAVLLVDAICGAAAAAVFVGYLMGFCTARTSATQYALLFAVYALTPHLLRYSVAQAIPTLGYTWFFAVTIIVALPGLWLLGRMSRLTPVATATAATVDQRSP